MPKDAPNPTYLAYNEEIADDIVTAVIEYYYPLFIELQTGMEALVKKEIDENEIWIERTNNK